MAASEAAGDGDLVPKAVGRYSYIKPDGSEDYWSYWYHLESSDADSDGFTLNDTTHGRYALHTSENVTFNRRVYVEGNVELALGDNATLTVNGGICVGLGSSLTIFCQKDGTGKLVANGSEQNAAIGGDGLRQTGSITIYGGNIEATGGENGAGIGGGYNWDSGTITIFGGNIKATGGTNGAGIGSGCYGEVDCISIYGGMVTSTGGHGAAGIGSGFSAPVDGKITIKGGTVNATGGTDGAGIGGGDGSGCNCDTLVIEGGTVNAAGGDYAAGIGGGYKALSGAAIKGGTVNATGGYSGAGIGGGYEAGAADILITGGEVYVKGGYQSAGIGGGRRGKGGNITITGGTLAVVKGENTDTSMYVATIGSGADEIDPDDPKPDRCTLNLGDRLRVGIAKDYDIEWVPAAQRVSYCQSTYMLRLEICESHSYENGACVYCGAGQSMVARPKPSNDLMIVTVRATGDTSLNATWCAVQGAEGYDVFFTNCGSDDFALVGSVAAGQPLTFDFTGLSAHRGYKAIVKAWQGEGASREYVKESPVSHSYTGGSLGKLVVPVSLTVKKDNLLIKLGKTANIRATVKGAKGGEALSHDGKLRYITSDPAVATVSAKGKVKAVGAGSCQIYVLTSNGLWDVVTVAVDASPTRVAFKSGGKIVRVGKTLDLGGRVKLTPAKAQTALAWASSNPAVATVDADGVVTALRKGKTTITATASNGKRAKVTIRVK